jgi:hypothetical protein
VSRCASGEPDCIMLTERLDSPRAAVTNMDLQQRRACARMEMAAISSPFALIVILSSGLQHNILENSQASDSRDANCDARRLDSFRSPSLARRPKEPR